MDTDRNLLFGVLALQADLLDAARFAEACTAWTARKDVPLADLLIERGWITPADKAGIEWLLQRKLTKHSGDTKASLAAVAGDEVQRVLAMLEDPDIAASLAGLSSVDGRAPLTTVNLPPQTRARYTLTRLHAKGGIGQVWLARDGSLGREVALKELRPEQADKPVLWARFLDEAKITGQLEHPGIVPIYELARRPRDDQPFYTMRFVKGRTLSEAVETYHQERTAGTRGPLAQRALLTAFLGVCNAVAYAHSRGVVHRDLKGANVVLGDFGEVIVLDWGLAKVLGRPEGHALPPVVLDAETERDATLQGQVLGTPVYMAPEQAEGRHDLIDTRTDVYGLGAILYEMLTGRAPFQGPDTPAVLRKVCADPPVPPRQLCAEVPLPLQAVCLKALSKRREHRYAAATDLAADVQRWLADEPVSAFREPVAVRAGRWTRRHRTWVAGAAAAACVAVVTLSVATVLLQKAKGVAELREQEATEQRRQAQEQRDEAKAKYQLAREAVDQMLTEVGEKRLKDVPQMEPVRRALLEKALAFYRKFLQEKSSDPALRRETAAAYERAGSINHLLGKHDEALTAYQQALELQRRLAEEFPTEPEYRADLAATSMSLTKLYVDLGRRNDAEPVTVAALRLLEELVRDHGGVAKYRRGLGDAYNAMGVHCQDSGRREPAKDYYQKSLTICERLLRDQPDDAETQFRMGVAQQNLGYLRTETGQLAEAEAAYQSALAIWAELVRKYPADTNYRDVQALTYSNLGHLYHRQLSQFDRAEPPYQQALTIREQLAREYPATTRFQAELGWASQDLGWLYQHMGQLARAEPLFQNALTIYERLAREHPKEPEYRNRLSGIYHHLGYYFATAGQKAKAEDFYQKALPIREQLAREQPQTVFYRQMLGQLYHELGVLYDTRQSDKCEAAYRNAIAVREELCRTQPEVPKYREDLAWSYTNLSILYAESGQRAKARDILDKALPLWEKLVQEHPRSVEYAAGLGCVYANRGSFIRDAGQPGEALDWYARGIQILEAAYKQEPRHSDARTNLRDAYGERARTYTQLQRHADAVKDWDRALELAPAPSRDTLRAKRALALVRAGEEAKAVAEADALTRGEKVPGSTLYDAACIYALAAARIKDDARLAEQHAARAVTLLRRAHALGQFQEAANFDGLKKDPDLNALRQRDDFKKLLAELEASPRPADKK